jgi:hypothetical protein
MKLPWVVSVKCLVNTDDCDSLLTPTIFRAYFRLELFRKTIMSDELERIGEEAVVTIS